MFDFYSLDCNKASPALFCVCDFFFRVDANSKVYSFELNLFSAVSSKVGAVLLLKYSRS